MISLKSKITRSILEYFFMNSHARHYVNELAKILNVDPKNLHTKLEELEREGLLRSEFSGKQRYFFLNQNYPLLAEYRKIFVKTFFESRLKTVLFSAGVKEAYLFGSYAEGVMDVASDIDVLAVGDHSAVTLQKEINKLQKEISREINVVNMNREEFEKRKKQKNQFINRVLSGKHIKLL